MIKGSNRLDTVKEYYFSKKLREVASLIKSGKPIINMGIGSPDLFPSKTVINILKNSLSDLNSHRYQSYQGLPELREAISKFYLKFFKVKSSPVDEILPLMGSKEGIMHISMAFLNKGDEEIGSIIKKIKNGFMVTEMLGMSFNPLNGDYSRGATGFKIENGEITYPISEVTVAGNLAEMLKNLIPANDLKINDNINSPSILIEGMTLAGL